MIFDLRDNGGNGTSKNAYFVPVFCHFVPFSSHFLSIFSYFCPIFVHLCPICVPLSSHFLPFSSHVPQPPPATTPRSPHPVCYARYFPISQERTPPTVNDGLQMIEDLGPLWRSVILSLRETPDFRTAEVMPAFDHALLVIGGGDNLHDDSAFEATARIEELDVGQSLLLVYNNALTLVVRRVAEAAYRVAIVRGFYWGPDEVHPITSASSGRQTWKPVCPGGVWR